MNLYSYDILINDVFYRGWYILEYIENHPNLPYLEELAIKATIMDALVEKQLIDPSAYALDFKNMQIVPVASQEKNENLYFYEKHPNICGIPLWMKEKFRHRFVAVIGGIPISLKLSKPPSKFVRTCVYDPNTAVSSIFDDATFINAIYDSPTRPGVRLTESRPFVEVTIDGVDYLVDVLTKRLLKSEWFKNEFNMEVLECSTISEFSKERRAYYEEQIRPENNLSVILLFNEQFSVNYNPAYAEFKYEMELTKNLYPESWDELNEHKKKQQEFNTEMYLKREKIKTENEQ